jgi:glycosyltransferase involved in cell wall biosynthesis
MKNQYPTRVLIAGGKTGGGVASFAEALRLGLSELGLPAEVAPPGNILRRIDELRDPAILKILSLSAVFAAPAARRAICVSHGVPCVAYQGWRTWFAILASYRMATAGKGTQLVAVSDYTAAHLRAIFNLRVDAVIRNPLHPLFLRASPEGETKREAIMYVGRLVTAKNPHLLLPAMREVLNENAGLRIWIAGEGPLRHQLEQIANGDERIEFLGALQPREVCRRLQQARVFVSGSPTEPFGITYLEALSQGCAVVMPASGGGLEIAPEQIGGRIQLFPASMSRREIASAIRRALLSSPKAVDLTDYSARAVARAYLSADACFDAEGIFHVERHDENRREVCTVAGLADGAYPQ